jgi:phage-related protein
MLFYVRQVIWLGDSRKNMQEFAEKVRSDMGSALFVAQCGSMAMHVKPFTGVGSGAFEITERYSTDTSRVVYAVQAPRYTCCMPFQKKSKSGIATPNPDVDLI